MPGLGLEPRAGVDRPRPHPADRRSDVVGGELAGEDDPSLGGRCSLQVTGLVCLPGEVEQARHLLSLAQEHAVAAAHGALGALVHLVEIGVGLAGLADPDRDGEHRVRHGERFRDRAWRVGLEHEAGQVGSRLDRDGHVLLPRQPADLDERPGEELAQLRCRV